MLRPRRRGLLPLAALSGLLAATSAGAAPAASADPALPPDAAPPSTAAPAPDPASPPPAAPLDAAALRERLGRITAVLDALDARRARAPEELVDADAPHRELRLALERRIHELSVTAPVRARLATAQSLLDRGDAAAAEVALGLALEDAAALARLVQSLDGYVARREQLDERATSLGALLEANAVETPHRAAIERLEARLAARELLGQYTVALADEIPALDRLYGVAQSQAFYAATAAALRRPRSAFDTETRIADCPPPQAPDPAAKKPSVIAEASAPTEDYYPARAIRQGFEGRAVVRASISPEGCARDAQVLVSTGDADLDAAAIRWTLEGAVFRPVQRDGRAAQADVVFNFRFRLAE